MHAATAQHDRRIDFTLTPGHTKDAPQGEQLWNQFKNRHLQSSAHSQRQYPLTPEPNHLNIET